MPHVAAGAQGSQHGLVVLADEDAVQYALGGHDLVRAHDQKLLVHVEDAVLRQDVQQSMLREEGGGEGHQVEDGHVVGVRPPAGELEAVGGLLAAGLLSGALLDGAEARGVGVVLGVGAVGDDEDLHVLVQAAAGPEAVALVALDLVEGLLDGHAAALELDVHERQAVHQHRHVVAVLVIALLRVLVHHLHAVVVHVALVDERDVAHGSVVHLQGVDVVALDAAGLLHDAVVVRRDPALEQAGPLPVGEGDAVQGLELPAQVGNKVAFAGDDEPLVALAAELLYEGVLQLGFRLIRRRAFLLFRQGRADRRLAAEGHDVKVDVARQGVCQRGGVLRSRHACIFIVDLTHAVFSLKARSLSR